MRFPLKSHISEWVSPPSPKNVILLFLTSLVSVMGVSLCIGELDIPYTGKTLWELGVFALGWAFNELYCLGCLALDWAVREVPVASDRIASNYAFSTCAVGVLWMTHIYLRVQKTKRFASRPVDMVGVLASVYLLVLYFACEDEVLPLHASFFSRIAVYCSISVMVFCIFTLLVFRTKDSTRATARDDIDFNCGVACIAGVVCLLSAFATCFHGGNDSSVSFFGYQLVNAVFHLAANAVGVGMGVYFVEIAEELAVAASVKPVTGDTKPVGAAGGAVSKPVTPVRAQGKAPHGPTAKDWREGH